jgi:hypothetical protein
VAGCDLDGEMSSAGSFMNTSASRHDSYQSAAWPYLRQGSWVKMEDDPLDEDPPAQVRRTLEAIRYVDRLTLQGPFEGLALRYGGFYGPGS